MIGAARHCVLGAAAVLVCALTAVSGGCVQTGSGAKDVAAPAADEYPDVASLTSGAPSAAGTYYIAYATDPAAIPLNASFSIEAQVLEGGRDGRAARDVALAVDARMPEHEHGMNVEPVVRPIGPGRFRVEGLLFHMAGFWQMYFDVTRGAVTERAIVRVDLE